MSDLSYVEALDAIDGSIAALQKARELLTDELEPLMTVEEVSTYFNCSNQHIYNLIASGALHSRKIGGVHRFCRAEVISLGIDTSA